MSQYDFMHPEFVFCKPCGYCGKMSRGKRETLPLLGGGQDRVRVWFFDLNSRLGTPEGSD